MAARILVVEDEAEVGRYLESLFQEEGVETCLTEDAEEAMLKVRQSLPDMILSDVKLKGTDGIALCRQLKTVKQTALAVVLVAVACDQGSPAGCIRTNSCAGRGGHRGQA